MTAIATTRRPSTVTLRARRGAMAITFMLVSSWLVAASGSSAPSPMNELGESPSVSPDQRYRLTGSVSIAAPQRETSAAAGYRLEGGVVGVLDENGVEMPSNRAPRWPVMPASPKP